MSDASHPTLTVQGIRRLTPTVVELSLRASRSISFQPGQYIEVSPIENTVPDVALVEAELPVSLAAERATDDEYTAEPPEFVPFSIASAPSEPMLQLCIKQVPGDRLGEQLSHVRVDDRFHHKPPAGDFLFQPRAGRGLCFLATGTGIAPIRSMLRSQAFLARDPLTPVTIVLGVRDEQELLYADELSAIPGVRWCPVLSRPSEEWTGWRGRVDAALAARPTWLPWSETDVYLCGQTEMVLHMKAWLQTQGTPADGIFHEGWINYVTA